ncbi:hypothetical protein Cni_G21902 [Canna indica]|uniref:Reverse transcriptase zinc-binding domain-containing protein n=1 Tax=Canna indica TaxID=4628 RepID=A0AAQ3KU37_9LILI|nr:hypothetical protein Cni_G21902 [Canna indica]
MENLKEGFAMNVANGKKTSLWNDPWLKTIPLCKWPTYINVEEFEKFGLVSELIERNGWNKEKIKKCFDESLGERIAVIQLNEEGKEDRWVWGKSISGQLSTKNVYCFVKEKESEVEMIDFSWNKLWALNVTERVKIFLWKLIWGMLPTSEWFCSKNGEETQKCFICSDEVDGFSHILFKCSFA